MGFASSYLEKRAIFPRLIKEAPVSGTSIIIVVPSYNEPGITGLLDSLASCNPPACEVEVMVVFNAPRRTISENTGNNSESINKTIQWQKEKHQLPFRLFTVDVTSHSTGGWGVGLARKTGMDEAVRRFDFLERPDGVILSLDADCKVESNYLTEIDKELYRKKERAACSIYFEHPVSGNEFSQNIYRSAALYELHLRYYLQGIIYTGFPYTYHTLGSAMAVKAHAYVKAGGMNKRQAGEDFYFIQKLMPAGGYFSLNTTTVHPSPRLSDRVPFGTGVTISKILREKSRDLLTYNFNSFRELRLFFGMVGDIYNCSKGNYDKFYLTLPESIRIFIGIREWKDKITEIKFNTSGFQSFKKRFFNWFNMFKVVKYMNFVHEGLFKKTPVKQASRQLLLEKNIFCDSDDPVNLLKCYRELEK